MSPNQTVINQFKEFLLTEAMVDVILDCDGQNLKAHKIVLSAYSPFFRSLFLKNPCEQPIVILKDMKYTELKIIIDFMYCGEVDIAEDQISAVIKTAQTLRVRGLGEVDFEKSQSNVETESPSGDRSENSTSNVSKNQSGDKFCFKWNNHLNVMNEFKNFLSSETMVDVTLGCDGQSLKAHKIILSAYSPFFRSLFLENPCKHPIVILKDMKYTELKSVIDFMYCREVNIAEDQLSAVIKTAQALKVKGFVTLESQNSQSGDEFGNHTIGAESKNQSGDELPHEPICMINVSSWTLMQKQSLGDQTIDGGFVTEIKQENMSDDMDVNISHTKTTAMSLQSHDANTYIKSEPVEQNFDNSFGSEESFEGSSKHKCTCWLPQEQKSLHVSATDNSGAKNNMQLPRQSFQSSVQSNMELHESNISNSDNQESSSTSSATVLKSRRKKKKLKNIPEKSVRQLCNSQKLGNINNMPRKKQKNQRPSALRRQTWDKAKMAEAIKKVRNKEMSFLKASKVFEVPKTTLRRLALQVEKLPEAVVKQKMGRKPVFTDQMENELVELLLEKESICLGFTNQDVRKLAFQLAERNKIPHPFHNEAAGRAWLDNFLARHKQKLLIGTPTETACAQGEGFSSEQVSPLFNALEAEYAKHSLQPDKILNADETGVAGVRSKVSQVVNLKGKQPITTSEPTTENEFRAADVSSLNIADANLITADHSSLLTNLASTSPSTSPDRQTPKSDLTSQEMSIMSASPSTPAISAPSTSEIITCRLFLPVPPSKKKTYSRCHKQSSAPINSASPLEKYLVEPKKHVSQRQGCGKHQERWRYGTQGMKKKEPQPEPSDLPSDAADLTFNLTVKEDCRHPSGRTIFKCLQR